MEINEACQSCAYWQAKKGNFGVCKTFPERKPYDGSKKGSACRGWRISNQLNKTITQQSVIIANEREGYKSLRKVYNDLHKRSFKATHATNVDGEFVTYTSDIYFKNGYFKHRYNFKVIDTVLTLFLHGKKYKEIKKHLEENHMVMPDRRTWRQWVLTFLGKNAWEEYHLYIKRAYSKKVIPKRDVKCMIGGELCKGTVKNYPMFGNRVLLCQRHRMLSMNLNR